MDAVEGVLDIGDAVPPFTLDSQVGEVDFEDIVDGKWCLLITVGAAFDPVATTDVGMLSRFEMEFESRNINVLVVGNDSVPNYRKWVRDIEELQAVKVNVPLMSDKECNILKKFGCARYMAKEGKSAVCCFGQENSFHHQVGHNQWEEFLRGAEDVRRPAAFHSQQNFDALQLGTRTRYLTKW
jgi:alkyl hydroperoxide reductase subunit AhpC